jgi:pimeloyl-ACP methyl ester carboxylesterase
MVSSTVDSALQHAVPTSAPSRWLSWAELPRTGFALARLPLNLRRLAAAPKGDQSTVLVIPGFATTDRSTVVLRAYLNWLGYRAVGWELGRNLGAKTIGLRNERLHDRLAQLFCESQHKVSIIGWSMGGIMARMIARNSPDLVSRVISLGAPFTGDPFANHAWQVYERLTGHSLSHPIARAQIAESKLPLPVPAISLYSKSDGIVDWQCCLEPDRSSSHNIEVQSAHCAFGFDPVVLRTVADVLAWPLEGRT